MIEQEIDTRDEEDLAMEAAHAAIEASRNGTSQSAQEPAAQQEPEPGVAEPAKEGNQPHSDEPFEGYSTLPEAVRRHFDEAREKAARAEALAASEAKLRNDRDAAIARVAPLQRELEKYRNSQTQKSQAPKPAGFDEWLGGTSKEYQQWAREFGEDAKLQYEHAMRVTADADKRIQSVEEKVEERFREFQTRAELDRLARTHSDYTEYTAGSARGAALRAWAESQGPDVVAAIESDSADEVSRALSVFKWEASDPVVRDTYADKDFQLWLSSQSRHVQAMARSIDIEDRKDAIHWYIGHLGKQEPAQADVKTAARVQELTQRREQQSRTVSPSFRPNVAPATAANVGGEDAEWAAANARIEQWRKRQ